MLFPQLQAWFCQKLHPNRAAFGPQNSKRMGSTDEEGEENLGTGGGRGVPGRRRGQARGDPAAAASARWAEAGIGAAPPARRAAEGTGPSPATSSAAAWRLARTGHGSDPVRRQPLLAVLARIERGREEDAFGWRERTCEDERREEEQREEGDGSASWSPYPPPRHGSGGGERERGGEGTGGAATSGAPGARSSTPSTPGARRRRGRPGSGGLKQPLTAAELYENRPPTTPESLTSPGWTGRRLWPGTMKTRWPEPTGRAALGNAGEAAGEVAAAAMFVGEAAA